MYYYLWDSQANDITKASDRNKEVLEMIYKWAAFNYKMYNKDTKNHNMTATRSFNKLCYAQELVDC